MIQALFCFSSARRRGQDNGWRWLPRRDKTARLSRHNRSVRLLARPGGHGHGGTRPWDRVGAGVPLQPCCGHAAAPRGARKRHDFCRVSAGGSPGQGRGQDPGVPADTLRPSQPLLCCREIQPRVLAPRHARCPRSSSPSKNTSGSTGTGCPPAFPAWGCSWGELLTSLLPLPAFLLTSGSFYPVLHHFCNNFCPHVGA